MDFAFIKHKEGFRYSNVKLKKMKLALLLPLFVLSAFVRYHQSESKILQNEDIELVRDSLRIFFGTYEFTPEFKMNIFTLNEKIFAQRVGDNDKFQIFPKSNRIFFLKVMPAELEFIRTVNGKYDTLVLHQGGKIMKAHRIFSQSFELYDTIQHLDSCLYAAYNSRNIKAFMTYFSTDLEFYHDQTGKTNHKENYDRFKENFLKSTLMRRELQKGSLEVYPIKDFGAIQIGTHKFYQTKKGEPEKLVAQPKFLHIWKKLDDNWKIVRIVSYDH